VNDGAVNVRDSSMSLLNELYNYQPTLIQNLISDLPDNRKEKILG